MKLLMGTSKVGIAFALSGIILLLLVWWLAFAGSLHLAALWAMITTAFAGGLVLFGLFLLLVGILIIII